MRTNRIWLYEALIFMTGAAVLALEVLSSRIMTPYFGVSLYIWAGILSITLIFLAVGYHLGGRVAVRYERDTLTLLFLAAPVASAIAVALAAGVYPIVFPMLSAIGLVPGSFAGATILLALPLVALSAMNPVLIALRDARAGGDAGAGRVFFISTVGSVAGVLLTAFVFIPSMTNYRALFSLALVLCVATAFSLKSENLSPRRKRHLLLGCTIGALLAGALLVGQQRYLDALAGYADDRYEFDVQAEYTSVFGNIKVVEIRPRDETAIPVLAYIQDGLIQNRATPDGVSVSMYTHVLEALAHAFVPGAADVVVLGLGAGIVPADFRRDGLEVSVVEINTDALDAATRFFRFNPDGIALYWEDARTFARRCRSRYDIVVVDLFQNDNTPDYLLTAEFFRDLRRCTRAGGAMIMNAFFDFQNEEPNLRLLATIAAAFGRVFEFRSVSANAFVVATTGPVPQNFQLDTSRMPASLVAPVGETLSSGRLVRSRDLAGFEPVTDDYNIFSILYSDAAMTQRRALATQLPPHILVN